MDKEHIENAANAYTQEIIDSNTFDVNYEESNYDAGSLHATSEVCPMAFKAGAEWRINSVWHSADVTPNENSDIVIIDGEDNDLYSISYSFNGYEDVWGKGWECCVRVYNIVKWAYLDDLLPTKKNNAG